MIAMTTSNSISVKAPRSGCRWGLGREILPEAGRQTAAARRLRLIWLPYHIFSLPSKEKPCWGGGNFFRSTLAIFDDRGRLLFNHEKKPGSTVGSPLPAGLFRPGVWLHGFGGKSLAQPDEWILGRWHQLVGRSASGYHRVHSDHQRQHQNRDDR